MIQRLRGRKVAIGLIVLIAAAAVLATARIADGGKSGSAGPKVVIAKTTRTNVIVILTDDQRSETLASMPNVQKYLVKHGVTFENSFVSDSLCCPSRASILTGNYAHTTGVYDNRPPHGGAPTFRKLGDDKSTIATWLQAGGYDTGLFGKYLNSYGGGVPPGWDRWVSFDYEPGYRPYLAFSNAPGDCPKGVKACRIHHKIKAYSTLFFGDAATKFIDTAPASKPVFVYYAPYAPHRPSVPQNIYTNRFQHLSQFRPPNYNEANVSDKPPWIRKLPRFGPVENAQLYAERQAEYQTLITVDREVGSIVASLKATHRLAHSVILFASDNGISWGEHRVGVGTKQLPYDEELRVPLVVRDEPATTKGFTDSHLIVNVDWAPTLVDIAGVKHPPTEGRSFQPLIDRTPLEKPWRTEFVLEHMNGNPPSLAPAFCGIRSTQYMYARYTGGFQELYNLKTDPYELQNVASDPAYAGVVAHMRTLTQEQCNPPPPGYVP